MSGSIASKQPTEASTRSSIRSSSTRMSMMMTQKKSGFVGALSSFFVAVLGGSVLNMPRGFRSAGTFIGLGMLALVAMVDHENCRVIVMATDLFRKAGGESYNGMEDLGFLGGKLFWKRFVGPARSVLFGNIFYYAISIIALTDLAFTAFSKIIWFTNSSLILVELFGWSKKAPPGSAFSEIPLAQWLVAVFSFLVFVVVCFIENVEFLGRISWVGSTCMFSIIALVIGGSIYRIALDGLLEERINTLPIISEGEGFFASSGTLYGLYIFSYAGVETYLYQLRGMKDPSNGLNVSLWGHIIAGSVYALVCIFGVLGFPVIPSSIHEADGMPAWITGTVAVLLMIANWPAFLCFYLPAVEVVESWFGIKRGILRTLLRILFLATLSILSVFLEDMVSTVQAITGNLTTGSLCLFFPFLIYWMLKLGLDGESTRDVEDNEEEFVDTSPLRTKIQACISFVAFAAALMFIIPIVIQIATE